MTFPQITILTMSSAAANAPEAIMPHDISTSTSLLSEMPNSSTINRQSRQQQVCTESHRPPLPHFSAFPCASYYQSPFLRESAAGAACVVASASTKQLLVVAGRQSLGARRPWLLVGQRATV